MPGEQDNRDDQRADDRKRPYAKPRLQEYGSVAKLTQSGGTTKIEASTISKACL